MFCFFFFPPKKEKKVFHMVTVALFCLEFVEEFSSIGSCSTASTRHFINQNVLLLCMHAFWQTSVNHVITICFFQVQCTRILNVEDCNRLLRLLVKSKFGSSGIKFSTQLNQAQKTGRISTSSYISLGNTPMGM